MKTAQSKPRKSFLTSSSYGILAAAIAAAGAASTPAFAQDEDDGNILLDSITVFARKKEENKQSVPISITALSGDQLDKLGINESGELAMFTTNFTWNSEFGKTSPQVYLRGMGSNNFGPNNTGPVAVYQDNVYHGPNVTHAFAAFDLNRVEVLKGPQGTLYGRNSTAGLVNFISNRPEVGREANGHIRAEVGQFQTVNVEAAVGVPIGETLAIRAAAAVNRNNGFWDNNNPQSDSRAGRVEDFAARFQVGYEPSDNIRINANLHMAYATPDTEPFRQLGINCPAGVTPGFSNGDSNCPDNFGFRDTGDDFDTFTQNDREEVDSFGGILEAVIGFGPVELHSTTGYDKAKHRRLDDVDSSPLSSAFDNFSDDFEYWSQDLRLTDTGNMPFEWHLGFYYYDEKYDGFVSEDFGGGALGFVLGDRAIDTTSWAVYGQAGVDLTETLSVTGGIRFTNEKKEVLRYNTGSYTPNAATTAGAFTENIDDLPGLSLTDIRTDTSRTFEEVTWRVSVDYTFAESALLYASVGRGFKGGEVATLGFTPINTAIIDPEIVLAYEIGLKSDWSGDFGQVQANAAVFLNDYSDQQVSTFVTDPLAPQGASAALDNAGSSEILGFELDVTWSPTPPWTIRTSVGYVDAKFDEFNSATVIGDVTGNRIPFVPELEVTGLVRYDHSFADNSGLAVQLDAQYQSDVFFQPSNDPFLSEDGYVLGNALIEWTAADEDLSIFARVTNIANSANFVAGFDFTGVTGAYPLKTNRPRTITAGVRYGF